MVRETDMAANRGRTDLWSLDIVTKGAPPGGLHAHPENDGTPVDQRRSLHLFSFLRSGSDQVWRLPSSRRRGGTDDDLPLDVGSFKSRTDASETRSLMDVFRRLRRCCPAPLRAGRKEEDSKATGVVYDRIFIRHWDTWSDGRLSELFVLTLDNGAVKGDPIALTASLDADVPSKPLATPPSTHSRPTTQK